MATRKKRGTTTSGGRGSPEAIEKRRLARQLNSLLTGGGAAAATKLDGRTEKRRKRLVAELKGAKSKELKPIEIVSSVNELLEIGETLASLKKQGVKPLKMDVSDETMELVQQTQAAYGFDPRAWQFLGIRLEGDGGEEAAEAPKRGRRAAKKAGTRKRKTSKR